MTKTVSIQIPQLLYNRLEQAANRLQKPVENLLVETLQATLAAIDEIPEQIRADVVALERLNEADLQAVAVSEMDLDDQKMFEHLLEMQGIRPLSSDETHQLDRLRNEYGRVLLRKARAFALLAERGHNLLQS